jgi:hypothetical protein
MSDDTRTEIAKRRIVYQSPDQATVVRRELAYPSADGTALPYDVYEPPGDAAAAPRPGIILVTGYNDEGMRRVFGCGARHTGAFESWARLLAGSGMVAVTYECRQPGADALALTRHVRASAAALRVDAERVGVWSCSGHVPTAVAVLIEEPGIAAAALLNGYLLDIDGHSEVTDAAARFRFAVPASGRSLDHLPAAAPLLLVRSGLDAMPGLNACLDRFVVHALARNLPVSVVNHATGPHAFDIVDDSVQSRAAIRQVIAFLTSQLGVAA